MTHTALWEGDKASFGVRIHACPLRGHLSNVQLLKHIVHLLPLVIGNVSPD